MDEAAHQLVKAFYEKDCDEKAFVNTAEFFVSRTTKHILNSNGVDVSYVRFAADGEFVVQCRKPQDVETYQMFKFDDLSCDELARKPEQIISRTKDRAIAESALPSGKYDVVLSDESVADILSYYKDRASASYIYQKYSDFGVEKSVQGDLEQVKGEKLNIAFVPSAPFSDEGLEVKELTMAEGGVLKNIQADCRFASYLGVTATGLYSKIRCAAGSVPFEEMKRKGRLYIVNFSDFQMDSMEGNFAGEIRLAYYFDGERTMPVTGVSINGDIFEAQKSFVLSKEIQKDSRFEEPYAVLLKGVNVAGV